MDYKLPITRTKIIIPRRRPELITRPRLLSILDEAQDFRLSIIAAPAGYGKTSLLIDYAHQCQLPVCWLALDALDQDPQRMISHFIYAIQRVFPEFGKSSIATLASMPQGGLSLDTLVSLLVNDAFEAISEHFIIVLDDYHLVEDNADINYFINRFLMLVDENCHLIISSRRLLPLADMTLLVARNQVGGLGFEELSFQPDEIKKLYLQNHHISLSDREAHELVQATEGWITGLVLSTQVSGDKVIRQVYPNNVAGVGLYDYLAQQVLSSQPEEIQKFLFQTSLLEEFNAALCEKVIGRALNQTRDWGAMMQLAQRNNLFVLPVIEEDIWLRYHHLFRDFLKHRMVQLYPDETQKIELRLAEYYMEINEWEQAYQVYSRIGNKKDIVHLIEEAGAAMIALGRLQTLGRWLEALPANDLQKSARLISLYGATLVMLGDTRNGIRQLSIGIDMLREGQDAYNLAHTYVRRSGAYRLTGEINKALDDAEMAIQISESKSDLRPIQAGAYYSKGTALHLHGMLIQAQDWLTKAREAFMDAGDNEASAKAAMEIGLVSRRLGQFELAEEIYQQVLKYYQSTHNVVWMANLLNNIGVLHHLAGDYKSALLDFERSILYSKMGGYQRLEGYALVSLGDLFRDIKALKESNEAYSRAEVILTRINDQFLDLFLCLSQFELDLYRGRIPRAKSDLDKAQKIASSIGSQFEINLCRFNRGKLALLLKGTEEAVADLESASKFFTKEHYFVEVIKSDLWLGLAYYSTGQIAEGKANLARVVTRLRAGSISNVLAFTSQPFENASEFLRESGLSIEKESSLQELGRYIDEFEKKLPSLRKYLRRQSQIVPFSAPGLSVTTFGKIQVKIGEHIVSGMEWQSQNARDLLLYLLVHSDGKTKEEIGGVLWPESSLAELKLRFKNTIYRLRRAVGKDVIIFENDLYSFNQAIDFEADFEIFVREIEAAKETENKSEQVDHYRQALKQYNGSFLPELSDLWVLTNRERYHRMYQAAKYDLASLLFELGDYSGLINTTSFYLEEDRCNEEITRIVMRAYAALGNQAEVIRKFETCAKALKEEFGSLPSKDTLDLYRTLVSKPSAIP